MIPDNDRTFETYRCPICMERNSDVLTFNAGEWRYTGNMLDGAMQPARPRVCSGKCQRALLPVPLCCLGAHKW
jgi:hypothetical protein